MVRPILPILLAVLLILSGCSGFTGSDETRTTASATTTPDSPVSTQTVTTTPQPAGWVEVEAVDTVPENATVISANNSSVAHIEIVQSLLESNESAQYLPEDELDAVETEMPHEYIFEGDRFGWYLRYNQNVYRVRIIWYA